VLSLRLEIQIRSSEDAVRSLIAVLEWASRVTINIKRGATTGWSKIRGISPVVIDAGIAASLVVIGALAMRSEVELDSADVASWAAYLLGGLIATPLVFRRRWPIRVLICVNLLAILFQFIVSPEEISTAQSLPLMFALYAVGAYGLKWRSLVWGFAISAPLLWYVSPGFPLSGSTVANLSWVITCLTIGGAIRVKRERARLLEERRLEDARNMVVEERLRIARELHDVVAHSIATISVQAGMAAHIFDDQPEQARAAVLEIRRLSKDALKELRATLGVLRMADDQSGALAPAPGLSEICELIKGAKKSGVNVDLETEGEARTLPALVDLTAYRIVQEALTNVVRHAGPTEAKVTIRFEPGQLDLRVRDNGRGMSQAHGKSGEGSRLGLVGMHERVTSVGGEFRAGNRREGGFEVRASLPTGET